jgi:RimJ/RimL family protein N-acetyltransferase
VIVAETDRLVLRQWREEDKAPFAAMNADPEVMTYFPAPLGREESDLIVDRNRRRIAGRGWGLFAVDTKETGAFIGLVGLARPSFAAPFTPAVEIGWRLARPFWGRGFATEAATAVVAMAFGPLGLRKLVSFAPPANLRSQRVMLRIGMVRVPDGDFLHPGLAADHPLALHALYRLRARDWRQPEKKRADRAPSASQP